MHDMHNTVDVRPAVDPAQVSDDTAAVGDIIDRQGFAAAEFIITVGTIADANATLTPLLEEGDDSGLSDAAAVADADLLGTEAGATFAAADDDNIAKLGYTGVKRYVRLTLTPAANTGAMDFGAVVVLGHAKKGLFTTQKQ